MLRRDCCMQSRSNGLQLAAVYTAAGWPGTLKQNPTPTANRQSRHKGKPGTPEPQNPQNPRTREPSPEPCEPQTQNPPLVNIRYIIRNTENPSKTCPVENLRTVSEL